VDPERPARSRAGGGASIPPKRPTRVRLITGALALATVAGLVGLSLDTRSPGLLTVSSAFGLLALALLAIALAAGRPGLIGAALAVLAILSFGHAAIADGPDLGQAGLVGVGLLLVGELAQWSLDGRLPGRYDPAVHRTRALAITWLALAGLATAVLALLAVGVSIPAGIGTVVLAVAATMALLGLISIVALRSAGTPSAR
jgi:hypothetical protein